MVPQMLIRIMERTPGTLRELLGTGMILNHAELMFGEGARALKVVVFEEYRGFLLAILPPGAFLGLGLLIAAKNWIDKRRERRAARKAVAPTTGHGLTRPRTSESGRPTTPNSIRARPIAPAE